MTPEEIAKLPYRPCVGVMIRNESGDVFVGQRLDHYSEAWQMPQGGVDPGEDPQEAALRELWEETGIAPELVSVIAQTEEWFTYDLPDELMGKIWKGKYRGQAQKWFLLAFQGTDAQVQIDTDHPEFRAWKWLPASELIDNIVPFKRAVYTQVLNAFAPYLGTDATHAANKP